MALAFYHQQIKKNTRIEFVENWFSRAYYTHHIDFWSKFAKNNLPNNIINSKNKNKKSRHCRCIMTDTNNNKTSGRRLNKKYNNKPESKL